MVILGDFVCPKNEKHARHPDVIYEIGKLIIGTVLSNTWSRDSAYQTDCITAAYTKLIKGVEVFDRREWPLDPGERFGEEQLRHLCARLHIADERKVIFAFR